MGSSYGIIKLDIYISYYETMKCIEDLENNLMKLNYHIMNSSLLLNAIKESNAEILEKYINNIIQETKFVIICVNKNILKSYSQVIETNALISNNFHDNKIIYLMLESDYTLDNSDIKYSSKHNNWYPFYDDNSRKETYNKLLNILSVNLL